MVVEIFSKVTVGIGKSVIGSNVHIEVNEFFTHSASCF